MGTGRAGLGSIDPKLEGTYEARLTDTPQEVLMVTEMKPDGAYKQTSTIEVPEGTVVVTLLGTYSTQGDQFRFEPTSLTPEYNVPDADRMRIASRVAPVIWALRAMSKGERDYTYTVDDAAFIVTDWNGQRTKWLRTKGKGGLPVVAPPPPQAAPVIPPVTAPYREPSPPPAPSAGESGGGSPGEGYSGGGYQQGGYQQGGYQQGGSQGDYGDQSGAGGAYSGEGSPGDPNGDRSSGYVGG